MEARRQAESLAPPNRCGLREIYALVRQDRRSPGGFGIVRIVRYFFTRKQPEPFRILLVESGARHILEGLITGLRRSYGEALRVDVVTCFAGLPRGFRAETTEVYRVTDYRGRTARARLFAQLRANRYSTVGIICSDEPIMTKWKWAIALRVPAKVFVLNENGDYFFLDWSHWRTIRQFVLYRAGLAGAGAARTLAQFFLFPFMLTYLLIYVGAAHLRRAAHMVRGGRT